MVKLIFQNLTEQLLKKELDYTQLEEKQAEECARTTRVQAGLRQKELDCQRLQARLSAADTALQRVQAELGEKGEAAHRLREELSEAESKHQHLRAELKQVQQQRDEKQQQGAQLQGEVNQVRRRFLAPPSTRPGPRLVVVAELVQNVICFSVRPHFISFQFP